MADEYPTQLALVAAGQGCAIIPRLGRDFVPEGARVVPILPRPSRRIYAFWRTDAARRPAIRAAVEALRIASVAAAPTAAIVARWLRALTGDFARDPRAAGGQRGWSGGSDRPRAGPSARSGWSGRSGTPARAIASTCG